MKIVHVLVAAEKVCGFAANTISFTRVLEEDTRTVVEPKKTVYLFATKSFLSEHPTPKMVQLASFTRRSFACFCLAAVFVDVGMLSLSLMVAITFAIYNVEGINFS